MPQHLRLAVREISKRYRLRPQSAISVTERLSTWARRAFRRTSPSDAGEGWFWALKDVTFDVEEGDRLGIIGRNGAGKTTLLKILSRVAYPTEGEARIWGRVTSLLEVGTGFNPKLSGRDNIYLNASLYGLTHREIKSKFEEIVEFSGVGKFLDLAVNHYSSGMRMRLAFSVAAHLDPDILLLDEVLSVGDLAFQQKCLKRVEGLTSQGRTMLLVSHSMSDIARYCTKVIWLDQGTIRFHGEPAVGIELYQKEVGVATEDSPRIESFVERHGTGAARFTRLEILDSDLNPCRQVQTGRDVCFRLDYEFQEPWDQGLRDVYACIVMENEKQQRLFGLPSEVLPVDLTDLGLRGRLACRVKRLPLVPGVYSVTVSLLLNRQLVDKVVGARKLIVAEGDYYRTGRLPLASYGQVCVDFDWTHERTEPFPAAGRAQQPVVD